MTDALSEPKDRDQIIGREANARVNLGVLSRFLGAVFLALLGGLLLLDRALSRANQNQAATDAQSAGLLTEYFVDAHIALLDRISTVASEYGAANDSLRRNRLVMQLIAETGDIRRIWVADSTGRLRLNQSPPGVGDSTSSRFFGRLLSTRSNGPLTIAVAPPASHRVLIGFVRTSTSEARKRSSTTGLIVDGVALRNWLSRTTPNTRVTLAVLSGADTIAFLGEPDWGGQTIATSQRLVRLPTGGTWRVVTTHALTTRALRWGLWMFGVFGVGLLGIGLLREQRRALLVADRSVELERLYSDVKRANQAKSEFLANISHELRTPLNAIVGFVELLRDGFYGDLSPRQVLPVDRIAASATHLRHLVDQVLDIAKIAAGRLEVHSESIVLRAFVLNIASELESLVSEKALAFSITVGALLPRVRTDPTHLRQILINLIGNAVKYTPVGTVSVRARLIGAPLIANIRRTSTSTTEEMSARVLLSRAPRSGTWVALQVVDTGVGIAERDLERIFDEFEQVNAGPRGDSMQRGTGLGLAISRRLARLLGGELSVESERGRGSTFTVWLPVNPGDLKRESARPSTTTEDGSSA